jgi:glycosyltransferase involved in cell wall biosynthesis
VSLVIPTKNEARNIAWVLERLPDLIDEVILVDSSSDDTVAVAKAVRPDIRIVREARPGKGAALRAGFAHARGDYIVMIDADGSMAPAEIGRFVDELADGAELVKGSRFLTGGGTADMGALRRYGNGGLRSLVNSLYGCRFSDLCYGFMAFRRSALGVLDLGSDGDRDRDRGEGAARGAADRRGAELRGASAPRRVEPQHLARDGGRVLRTLVRERWARRRVERDVGPLALEPAV